MPVIIVIGGAVDRSLAATSGEDFPEVNAWLQRPEMEWS
jgi:hypothetical protein